MSILSFLLSYTCENQRDGMNVIAIITVSLYRCDVMIIAIYIQVCKIGRRTPVNNHLIQNLQNKISNSFMGENNQLNCVWSRDTSFGRKRGFLPCIPLHPPSQYPDTFSPSDHQNLFFNVKYKLVSDLNHNRNLTYARFAPVILWFCTKRPMARINCHTPSHTVPFNRYNLFGCRRKRAGERTQQGKIL